MDRARRMAWRDLLSGLAAPGLVTLAGCASGGSNWLDHTAFIVAPSHHELVLAYSFGGGVQHADAEPGASVAGSARSLIPRLERNDEIAATIAAASHLNDDPLMTFKTIGFKSGRVHFKLGSGPKIPRPWTTSP